MLQSYTNTLLMLIAIIVLPLVGKGQTLTSQQKNEIDNYKTLVDKYKETNNKSQTSQYLIKIAYIYWEADMSSDAINYFTQALDVNKITGNKNAILTISNNIGLIYSDLQQFDKAQTYFAEGLKYARETKDKEKIVSGLLNLASAIQSQKKHKESLPYLDEALLISQELNNLKLIRKCYSLYTEMYQQLGDNNNMTKYFELYTSFDRKIKEQEMADVKIKSQIEIATANAEKKAKELELNLKNYKLKAAEDSLNKAEQLTSEQKMKIELLNKEKIVQELANKQKEIEIREGRRIIYFFIAIFVFVAIFLVIISKLFLDKRKANKLLANKNNELNEKNTQIENQNHKLHEQNQQIEEQRKRLSDAVIYASRIQRAILPSQRAIAKNFPNSFIFYQPRDVVSGDFYWYAKHGNKAFIAAVDCTGHSVPGAFMSMIGNTLLNEIVNEKKIFEPGTILEKLNQSVITTLKNDENIDFDHLEDGMDMTLCCFDTDENMITIASAGHYVFIYKNNDFSMIEGSVHSIGGSITENFDVKFENFKIPIVSGITLYMFSDGYQDQFGGPNNKKFMSEQLKKMFGGMQHLSMAEQYEVVEKTFDAWKGNRRQMDDILVIGIRL